MSSVGIHPPKTPVTAGSMGMAKATTPNVCKMPGPPAPFVPSPLPNIAKSGSSPKGYSRTVKIEGKEVAIRGATFESMGDMASKGTGGGLISANTHGPAKFISPGSLTVKIEGKSVHLLGEPMLNNCGASGSPPNTGATMMGLRQKDQKKPRDNEKDIKCAVHECDKKEYDLTDIGDEDPCAALGQKKHDCVAKHDKVKNKEPEILSETYCDMTLDPPTPMFSDRTGQAIRNVHQAMATLENRPGYGSYQKGDLRRPDLIYKDKSGKQVVADAKFPCPADVPDGPGKKKGKKTGAMPSPKDSKSMLTGDQQRDYQAINGGELPQEIQPADCSEDDCK